MNTPCITPSPVLWMNGSFLPAQEARISPFDRGFLYGDGVFETMRSEKGRILFLQDHLERLEGAVRDLRIALSPQDWGRILGELIQRNGLSHRTAAVKILVSRGVCSGLGLPTPSQPTVCATAQEYAPPEATVYSKGWRLHLFRQGFTPPLSKYKSLNYLYFLMARQAAADAAADEAVVLDPSGNVSETSAGSLLLRTDGSWWTPLSDYQLPGTALKRVTALMEEGGQKVERRRVGMEALFSAETVWVLNSLLVIMPVGQVMAQPVPLLAQEEAMQLRVKFIQQGSAGMI